VRRTPPPPCWKPWCISKVDIADIPTSFQWLRISVPEEVALEVVNLAELPQDWAQDLAVTQRLGANWLRGGGSALLRVPSVLVPETWNVLLNPGHPDAGRCRIVSVHPYSLDPRLVGRPVG
jgi:RES domain-containing protein